MAKRGPRCLVCAHKDRALIEAHRAAGGSFDAIAFKFGLSKYAVWRHWTNHVSAELRASYLVGPIQLEALRAKAAEENHTVLEYFSIIRSTLMGSFSAAAEMGDANKVATVSGRLIEVLREIGKITGEVEKLSAGISITTNNVAIFSDPRMIELQTGLVKIAREIPDARTAILALLKDLDARPAAPRAAPMIECEAVDA